MVTICKTCLNNRKPLHFAHTVYVFCIILTVNRDFYYKQHKLVSLDNGDAVFSFLIPFMRQKLMADWVVKYSRLLLQQPALNNTVASSYLHTDCPALHLQLLISAMPAHSQFMTDISVLQLVHRITLFFIL
jgi:hypothetical protein